MPQDNQPLLFDTGITRKPNRPTGPLEERLKRLVKVKLEVENERDTWKKRFKAAKKKYAELIYAPVDSLIDPLHVSKLQHKNHLLKSRNRELVNRMDEVTNDYDRMFQMVSKFKDIVKCPKCEEQKHFDAYPLDPGKPLGRDMSRCNKCQAKKLRDYRKRKKKK